MRLIASVVIMYFLASASAYSQEGSAIEPPLPPVAQSISNTSNEANLNILLQMNKLEIILQNQNVVIDNLKKELTKKDDNKLENTFTYSVWTSILLGVAALILGGVGIGVAVLSFFGYKELLSKGTKEASKVANEVAKRVAKERVDSEMTIKSKEAIDSLVQSGYLEPIIEEIVQKFIYRGIDEGENLDDLEGDPVKNTNEQPD